MAKRPSAKQLAARRKFTAIMKSGGFKKRKSKSRAPVVHRRTPKRRTTPRKVVKHVKRRTPMARHKRRTPSRSRGFASKIPLINNPTFKKAAAGVGMATLGVTALALVAPSLAANPIVKPAFALLGGDVVGLAAQLFVGGGLSGILGGSRSSTVSGGSGFA